MVHNILRAHPWAATVVLVALLMLGGVVWLIKREPVLRGALSSIVPLMWAIWCYFYMFRWRLRMLARNFFVESALGFLLVASLYVVVEISLTILRNASALLRGLGVALNFLVVPEPPRLPVVIEVSLLVLGFLMAAHRWREWKLHKRQAEVPGAVDALLRQLGALRAAPTESAREAFLEVFMENLRRVLEIGSKRKIAISLMEKNDEGVLAITFKHPAEAQFDENFTLAEGKGGAGVAYQQKELVYIPSTRHVVGIKIGSQYTPLGETYQPARTEPFRSILCAPVVMNTEVVGVLTFSCDKRGAFLPLDFEIARMAGALLGLVD